MTSTLDTSALAAAWHDWHSAREAELTAPHGWLSPVGFHWLPAEPAALEGLSGRFGATPDGAVLEATAADDWQLVIDGVPGPVVEGIVSAPIAEGGSSLWLARGDLRVELLRRGGRVGVRLRSPEADTRREFRGLPAFPVDSSWVVEGEYTLFDEPRRTEVATARDDLRQHVSAIGTLVLALLGRQYTLTLTGGPGGGASLAFHDPTNADRTAPWRVVPVQLGENGHAVVDFNRAVNLPFALTAFGTCPTPVAGNTIDIPVTAGELRPWGDPR